MVNGVSTFYVLVLGGGRREWCAAGALRPGDSARARISSHHRRARPGHIESHGDWDCGHQQQLPVWDVSFSVVHHSVPGLVLVALERRPSRGRKPLSERSCDCVRHRRCSFVFPHTSWRLVPGQRHARIVGRGDDDDDVVARVVQPNCGLRNSSSGAVANHRRRQLLHHPFEYANSAEQWAQQGCGGGGVAAHGGSSVHCGIFVAAYSFRPSHVSSLGAPLGSPLACSFSFIDQFVEWKLFPLWN